MTSAINTNGIDVNYPIPGINNSTQGFRDNFAAIKTDLNTAANEITDLQNNVVLKQALNGTTLNNNMGNTLISNAVTRSFRASTYNLGSAISGVLIVNVSLGDVQYGTITGNTTIQFSGWAPIGTQSNVELQLSVANTQAVISLPTEVQINGAYGVETVENFSNVAGIPTLTIPYGVSQLDYRFSTLDCGTSITIEPYNRPRQATQVQQRTPSPIGKQGDVDGTFSLDPTTSVAYATCISTNGTYDYITCDSTSGFYLDMPVVFTGDVFGDILPGATYYVRSILSNTTFTISTLPGTASGPSSLLPLATDTGIMYVNPVSYMYACTGTYDGTIATKTASNTNVVTTSVTSTSTSATGNLINVTSTTGFVVGYPVAFSGTLSNAFITATYATSNVVTVSSTAGMVSGGRILLTGSTFGNLASGTIYYIKDIFTGNSNITLSTTFGGSNLALSTATGNCTGTYNGIMGNLIAGVDYFVQSIPSGTSFTVCANTPGGAPVQLVSENGAMTVTAVTDYTVTLNSSTGLSNNQPIEFSGTTFGGVQANKIYYIANIASGTDISLSTTINNGLSGQKLPVTNASGTMIANVTTGGTVIWKSVDLKPYNSIEDSSVVSQLLVYGDLSVTGNTQLANVTANIITANSATLTGNVSAANLAGNLTSNNITVNNLITIPGTSNIKINGGVNGYVLQTDGSGNLSWTAQTGGGTGTPGGSNTQIQFNDNTVFGGSANLTFNKSSNTLTIGNALSVGGNANIGNIGTGGLITATGNVTAGNLVTGGNLSVTGNANIGNIGTAGLITVTGNVNAGNIISGGIISATGNGTFGNISTAGTLSVGTLSITNLTATGNVAFSGSNVSLGAVGNLKITGGTNGYILSTDGTGNLSWVVKPNSGSAVITATMSGATKANPGVITTTSAHNLPEKALVTITDVVGMTQLNGNSYYANVLTSNTFSLYSDFTLSTPVDTSSYTTYISGGNITSTINGTGVGIAGGSNTQIQFNNSGYVGGAPGFTFNNSSNVMNAPGSITAVGNVVAGNISTGGTLSVTGTATMASISATSLLSTGTGTIGTTLTVAGNITAPRILNGTSDVYIVNNGNVAISVGGISNVIVATTTGANITGTLSVSGNANVGNILTTNGFFAGGIQGVTTLTANGNISTTDTGSIISNNFVYVGVSNSVTAAGTNLSGATTLTKAFNVVTTCPGNAGVKLPAAVAGMRVMVRNGNTGNTCYVYPAAAGTTINTLTAGNPYSLSANTTNEFYCVTSGTSGQWYSLS